MDLTPEQIQTNFDNYFSLLSKLGDRSEPAKKMVQHLGERLALAPASSKKHFHNCFPGGLVDHSLRVLSNCNKLVKTFNWDIKKDSLIIGCLFHDLGKVGDLEFDNYVPQTSEWHRDKQGEHYIKNVELPYMTIPDRGVWLCNQFGLALSLDEHLSIKLNDGFGVGDNKDYLLKISPLVYAVMTADYIATMQEKDKKWCASV